MNTEPLRGSEGDVRSVIQFTESEIERIRARMKDHSDIIQKMAERANGFLEAPLLVPKTGIANWGHYYCCPKCSVRLNFDRSSPNSHVCPQCGKAYSGEPYDSAWWGSVNGMNAGSAHNMGLLYLITGDRKYALGARDVVAAYARNYHNYEPHGDIPYNGPGRVGAQTLDEAGFQQSMVFTYDMIADALGEEDKRLIRDELFIPAAEFLVAHRTNQLHNHEVIINAAIAMIGILYDREDLIRFAVYEPYGLIYQLEHGVQDHGMWYEGSFGYHFYALRNFVSFEKFALHTRHSLIRHPHYRKMLAITQDYLQEDGEIPMLGDTTYGHLGGHADLYEFFYRELRDPRMLAMLNRLYEKRPRDTFGAILYGADELPACEALEPAQPFHPPVGLPGNTILRGPRERYLLLKQDRFGGEHDHYDRLGISYRAFGKPVAPDIGTALYGAALHYDYFKNTGAHNTVSIGEENQSPADARLTFFERKDGVTYVEAVCDWTLPFQKPDAFTITQWDEEAYRTVRMTRRVLWTDEFFAESFLVDGVTEDRSIDWVMHFSGSWVDTDGAGSFSEIGRLSEKKPLKHLRGVRETDGNACLTHTFEFEGVRTNVYSAPFEGQTYLGIGPDNPSYREIAYLIERQRGKTAAFSHVIETFREAPSIRGVRFAGNTEFLIEMADGSCRKLAWPREEKA